MAQLPLPVLIEHVQLVRLVELVRHEHPLEHLEHLLHLLGHQRATGSGCKFQPEHRTRPPNNHIYLGGCRTVA